MNWSFYDPSSGIFSGQTFSGPENALEQNTPKGLSTIIGIFDSSCQRVNIADGTIIDYQPTAPSADYLWDATSKRWYLNQTVAASERRRSFAQAQIDALELRQLRALRELALNPGNAVAITHITAIEAAIVALRLQLV